MSDTLEKIRRLVESGDVRISEHGYDELSNDDLTAREIANIPDRNLSEVPKIQKRSVPKALDEYDRLVESRNESIVMAYRSGDIHWSKLESITPCITLP